MPLNPRVLLVEDNETNQYLATFLLRRMGCEVALARNGVEGLAEARENPPDLVVLDIQMPAMDGYELAGRLRADPATAAAPILVVTSFAMPGDRDRAFALGVNDYMEKPYDPDDFTGRVRALLGGKA